MDSGEGREQEPLKRLWISSVTDKAIRDGFAHLKNAKEYENLYHAGNGESGVGLAGRY